jgi:catechol 2,3-dioxygenase-like lactoylglutathione lyase family enzyme
LAFDVTAITHTALTVPDLEDAMAAYGAALGLTWATPQSWTMHIRTDAGDVETPLRFTYSVQGPPHLELIAGEPGTVWAPTLGVHHVGVWTDALAGDAAELEASGIPIEAAGIDRSGNSPFGFTYHRSSDGFRVELVDEASRPAFERWFAGGDLR